MGVRFVASPKQEQAISHVLEWRDRLFPDGTSSGTATNRYTAILFGGAIRGGKSYWAIGTAILMCRIFPGSRWTIVRQSLPLLRQHTMPVFSNIYPIENLQQRPSQANNWTARFKNGSEIIFWSENYDQDKDLNRWRGLETNGFILEEANELQEASFNKALERVGTWKMNQSWDVGHTSPVYPAIILMTTNPATNWIKDTFYDRYHAGTLPENFKYIPALPTDNPNLPADFIEQKRMILPDYLFRKFIEGDWEVNENDRPFITEFDERIHVADLSQNWRADVPLYISMDFNVDPPAAVVCHYGNGYLWIMEEIDIGAGSIYDVASYIKRRFGHFRLRLTGDASGKAREKADRTLSNLYEIACREIGLDPKYDVDAPNSNMRIDNSRTLCNALFRGWQMGYRVLIDRGCKRLLMDIRSAQVDRTGDLVKNRQDKSAYLDYLDAFRYMCATAAPEFVEKPLRYIPSKR